MNKYPEYRYTPSLSVKILKSISFISDHFQHEWSRYPKSRCCAGMISVSAIQNAALKSQVVVISSREKYDLTVSHLTKYVERKSRWTGSKSNHWLSSFIYEAVYDRTMQNWKFMLEGVVDFFVICRYFGNIPLMI